MTIKYREGLFGTLAANKDISRVRAMVRIQRHLAKVGDSDYRIKRPDYDYGPQHGLMETMRRVRKLTKNNQFAGYKLVVKSDSPLAVAYAVLLTEPEPPLINTPGNLFVDLVYTMVFAKFPKASNLGNCYCRHIAGSPDWSQHAYCNAQDFGAPSGTNFWPTIEAIAHYLITNADRFGVNTVIWKDRIWTRGEGERSYGGQYHYHVHVDGFPNGVGTPDCAR